MLYADSSLTLHVIDYILLKRDVFVHYISHYTRKTLFCALMLNVIGLFSLSRCKIRVLHLTNSYHYKTDIRTILIGYTASLMTYILVNTVLFRLNKANRTEPCQNDETSSIHLTFTDILFSFLFSQSYLSLYLILYIWSYKSCIYYMALEFLLFCSLVVSISALFSNRIYAYTLGFLIGFIKFHIIIDTFTSQ